MESRTMLRMGLLFVLALCTLTMFAGAAVASEDCPDETAADCGVDDGEEHDDYYEGDDPNVSEETDVDAFADWVVSLIGL